MAIILNGTTHVLRSSSFGASRPSAYSIACWWRGDGAGNTTGDGSILSVGNSLGFPSDRGDLFLKWNASASLNCRAGLHTTASAYTGTSAAGTTTAGVWQSHCATYAATRLKFFQNGAQVGTTANLTVTAAAPADWHVSAGVLIGNADRGAGRICMIGYWDIELSDADCAALGRGFSPAHVRPQSLRYFVPGLRTSNAVIGETDTVTDITYTDDNPRIYA